MAAPTREEAVRNLEGGHARVDLLVSGVSEEDLTRPATIGGGDWSAKDLIGHLATWEEVALRTLREFQGGEMPWIERDEGPFSAPETGKVDAFNAQAVAEMKQRSLGEVRSEAERTHRELIDAIQAMSDEQWTAKAFYPTSSNRRRRLATLVGSVLAAPQRPFGHAFAHVPDLEAYTSSLG
ncbi:MAG: DinB family protein [Actinomycetota bacterium]